MLARREGKHAKDDQDARKIGLPKGLPPAQVLVSLTEDGKLLVQSEHGIPIRGGREAIGLLKPQRNMKLFCRLKDVQVLDTKGKEVAKDELANLLKDETVAVASFGPVDPLHLRILKEGTLVFILPPPPVDGMPLPGEDKVMPQGPGPGLAGILFLRMHRPDLESTEE